MRPIAVENFTPVQPVDQPAPHLLWVEIERLRIDDRYQRPLVQRNLDAIRKIADDFRWSRFAPVLVAPLAGGDFALVDGQHRAHAAAICGFDKVPAMSVLIDQKGQADAFHFVNANAIRIDGFQIFKAALAAGEIWAERCDAVVSAAGCDMMTYAPSVPARQPGRIFQLALIRRMVASGQATAVTAGLRALKAEADTGGRYSRPIAWSDTLIRPWLTALAERPQYLDRDLRAFLRSDGLLDTIRTAERLAGGAEFPSAKAGDLARKAVVAKLNAFFRVV